MSESEDLKFFKAFTISLLPPGPGQEQTVINDRYPRLSRRMRLDGLVLSADGRCLAVTGSSADRDSGHW